jgi:predicted nucleic acid-binding Zn ribbon protein
MARHGAAAIGAVFAASTGSVSPPVTERTDRIDVCIELPGPDIDDASFRRQRGGVRSSLKGRKQT